MWAEIEGIKKLSTISDILNILVNVFVTLLAILYITIHLSNKSLSLEALKTVLDVLLLTFVGINLMVTLVFIVVGIRILYAVYKFVHNPSNYGNEWSKQRNKILIIKVISKSVLANNCDSSQLQQVAW